MAKTKSIEQLAQEIFKECKADGEEVTMEEAVEMAKMEIGAKEIKNYVQSTVEKKVTKKKERKVDEEKGFILRHIKVLIEGLKAQSVTMKNEVELSFIYNGNSYTLKLTKHRPPKK